MNIFAAFARHITRNGEPVTAEQLEALYHNFDDTCWLWHGAMQRNKYRSWRPIMQGKNPVRLLVEKAEGETLSPAIHVRSSHPKGSSVKGLCVNPEHHRFLPTIDPKWGEPTVFLPFPQYDVESLIALGLVDTDDPHELRKKVGRWTSLEACQQAIDLKKAAGGRACEEISEEYLD